ncbi:MAG: GNAT family N-acetyltransferase [Chroococcus sp. CMT-3BRIN-NPC107]|jgi:GNAT superfamily N-acetyltransferase|nr:GNAT family N-acetyltransferase [Chroococcus sp. CMT-3BRIN-NPC107]
MIYEIQHNSRSEILLSTDNSKLDITTIHDFLKNSYWAKDVLMSVVEKAIKNSLCFGIYENSKQVGFARVISDYATSALLRDVFILDPYQGQGLGKWLIECILAYPALQDVPKWLLGTKDAHELYRRYGFENLTAPETLMIRLNVKVQSDT